MSDPIASPSAGGEKVEEVDLDAIEDEPAHSNTPTPATAAPPAAAAAAAPADAAAQVAGSTTVEEVLPEELAQKIPLPEYDTTPWLLVGPLLLALILMWNVDWRDARVKSELVGRRQRRAPATRKPAKESP